MTGSPQVDPHHCVQARHRILRQAFGQRTAGRHANLSTDVISSIDLPSQYSGLKNEIDTAVGRVLKSGRYVLGPEVEAFESEFGSSCGAAHAVGLNSGTSAIYLSLLALGIGPGDEVITVPYTFEATISAILATGATPRLIDIDPQSLTMDVALLENAVTERTKAVLPVHLFGQPADMDPILAISRRHGVSVIEDACQAHGATYKGTPVGGIGDLSCFSFYPSKNLSACGDAGMVVTKNASLADAIRHLRTWGPEQGSGNYRMAAIQAAILRVKLPHLEAWTTRRRVIASRYTELLKDTALGLPLTMAYSGHAFHIYAIRSSQQHALQENLRTQEIEVSVHYPQAVHQQKKYSGLNYQPGDFPVAEQLATEQLSLPIYPELSDETVTKVATAIRQL